VWVEWVGPGRVAGSAVVVVAVLVGAYWLVQPPPATTESKLPFASTATSTTGAVAASPSTTALTAATTGELVVHVAGAVLASGVYRLPGGSRVIDAIDAAGGLAAGAEPDAVNLAALLVDGERVYVPKLGEVPPVVVGGGGAGAGAAGTGGVAGPVDINRATADQLDELPGVGPATAAAIIAHRDQFGPFGSVDDLADVKGIGPAKVEALRGLVTV
jgi:competence protein ComEA